MDGNTQARRRPWGMAISAVVHVVVLAALLYRPEPPLLNPQSIKLGDSSKSYHVVYVPPHYESGEPEPTDDKSITFTTVARKRHAKPSPIKPKEASQSTPQGEVAEANRNAGVPYGDLWALMDQGHDVKPAIPVEYPSPDVSHSELPFGFQGDVVIEATIERDGRVTDVKVLKSINQGIDQKCLAAVQRWRFRPAFLDGTPIASRHDVHFHFPS